LDAESPSQLEKIAKKASTRGYFEKSIACTKICVLIVERMTFQIFSPKTARVRRSLAGEMIEPDGDWCVDFAWTPAKTSNFAVLAYGEGASDAQIRKRICEVVKGGTPDPLFGTQSMLTRLVAIAQFTRHGREHVIVLRLIVLRPGKAGMLAHTMFFSTEVRSNEEYKANTYAVSERN
jgi:hypothetical protein